ncbi:MAG: electron transfer flavoprotein subunit beta/FixA family protein [Pyrodictiaceae archaeon]
MKALVAIKLTYDVNQLKFERNGTPILDTCPRVMGDADKCAVEEAVRVKEKLGASTSVMTIGSLKEHYKIIRDAYAMGIDKGYIVRVDDAELLDAITVAKIIARFAEKTGPYDYIFLGSGASDTHSSVVGPLVAGLLNYKLIANVDKLSIDREGVVKATSMLEDGVYTWEARPPVVITVTSEANEPRIPTIKAILRSKRMPIEEITLDELGLEPRRINVKEIKRFIVKRKRIRIDATENVEEAVEKLIKFLEEEGVI